MRTKSLARMQEIVDYINGYYKMNGYSPSIRDIAQHIGLSAPSTLDYLNDMNERGMIYYSGERRSIFTPSMRRERSNRIPLLGEIACGKPLLAEENIECYLSLPISLSYAGECFALRAKGESMINAGIDDGDVVIIRKQSTAENGQIVVALVNGEDATLKRIYRNEPNRSFILCPENDEMQDMEYEDVQILGIAIKVLKDVR